MEEEHDCNCPPEGLPSYMGTFADLMALLMCFFVLLLSFAEMDVLKFKRLAGAMKTAFGVQREIAANSIPMGTSIIAQEFSPGRPEPTPVNKIMQRTSEEQQRNLQVQCTPDQLTPEQSITDDQSGGPDAKTGQQEDFIEQLADFINETRNDAISLANALAKQINAGEVEIETQGRVITVRIKEKGSFDSGSAKLQKGFEHVLHDVRDVLIGLKGGIEVQGHTDNVSISTARFRSNWELSSARAVSVAQELLYEGLLDPRRLTVSGFSYTRPLVDNDTPENRALNRRVEIVINQEDLPEDDPRFVPVEEQDAFVDTELDVDIAPLFNILPEEIF